MTLFLGEVFFNLLKHWGSILKFGLSSVLEILEYWLVYANKFSWIAQSTFWMGQINEVSISFFVQVFLKKVWLRKPRNTIPSRNLLFSYFLAFSPLFFFSTFAFFCCLAARKNKRLTKKRGDKKKRLQQNKTAAKN